MQQQDFTGNQVTKYMNALLLPLLLQSVKKLIAQEIKFVYLSEMLHYICLYDSIQLYTILFRFSVIRISLTGFLL